MYNLPLYYIIKEKGELKLFEILNKSENDFNENWNEYEKWVEEKMPLAIQDIERVKKQTNIVFPPYLQKNNKYKGRLEGVRRLHVRIQRTEKLFEIRAPIIVMISEIRMVKTAYENVKKQCFF